MTKKIFIIGVILIMGLGLFAGCGGNTVKQGLYVTTEDKSATEYASVKLYDDNKFAFDRGNATSYCPTGDYYVDNGKLTLRVSDDEEYIFDIKNGKLIFRSGVYAEELVKSGTVFKLSENK